MKIINYNISQISIKSSADEISRENYCNAAFTSRTCVVLPMINTIQCSNCYVALKSGSANAVWRHCFSGYVWQQNAQSSLWAQSLVTQVLGMSWLWQFLSRSVNAASQRRAHPPFVARENLTIRQTLWPCTTLDKCSEHTVRLRTVHVRLYELNSHL